MSTLKVNNITDTSGGSTNLTVPNTAKVWVNFNGTGTVAIRASFNVSSITDNGTGNYTVFFVNNLGDSNYSVFVHSGRASNDSNSFNGEDVGSRGLGGYRFTTGRDQDSTVHDVEICNSGTFR